MRNFASVGEYGLLLVPLEEDADGVALYRLVANYVSVEAVCCHYREINLFVLFHEVNEAFREEAAAEVRQVINDVPEHLGELALVQHLLQ